MIAYVLAGPASCGNQLGYFQPNNVPVGRFAVVSDGEYTNGGCGPISIDGGLYKTRERATAVAAQANEKCLASAS